ncbi:penicillin-binding protein [Mesobacillus persicus]|uniref:serine-type D-Ala-D-Ala carboxypeptidase n=1 Tax=Mesobacillus persicus TaxID=930146 RepID=A0A1H8H3L7_9BACI|nr:penicillin-binding transpeptidase domain-containing protein [Mesobacillus persicus]SEN50574.1 penicillin-binding protein [Mesobacillus persicus]
MKKAIILMTFVLTIILAGCMSKQPTPDERFAEYVSLWNEQNFEEMYELLSQPARETITKEDFVNRYHKIYQDLEIDQLDVLFNPPEEEEKYEEQAGFAYSAKMDSAAGPIEFDHTAVLVKEEREDDTNWYVNWDTTYIFPELGSADKISYDNIPAVRGSIVDRRGNGLAINGTAMQIGVVPGKMDENSVTKLSELLNMSEDQITKLLNASWVKADLFVPLKNISKTDEALKEKLFAVAGVTSMEVGAREYPYGEDLSHLVGFVAKVTAEDLENNEGKGYTAADYIGKRGLEQVFEEKLKGTNGVKISIVKEDGTEKVLAEKPVEDGEDVQLTIDVVLQQRIYDQMKGVAGTAAAMNPVTGETLALVSAPGFDPNAETLGISASQRQALEENPLKPYLNRFKLTYVPGSVMKPITAAVGLSTGKLKLDTTYEINEKQWQPDKSWGDYKVTRYTNLPGQVNLEKAMIYSDNIYFARSALEIGKEDFAAGLKKFGFEDMEYPYPLESSQMGELASEIALADSGYGQGQVEMNILHLAATYTPFVNNGNLIKPILLADETQKQIWAEGLVSAEQATGLNAMLTKVVSDPNGTAHAARIEGYPIAGKTGTAEIKATQGTKGRELGWFIGYNPELMISMMIEDVQTGGGSTAAVTKVKNVFLAEKE